MNNGKFSVMLAIPAMLLALALTVPAYAAMTSEEKGERYRAAVLELETYLESFGMSDTSLEGIEAEFKLLGGYAQSLPLMQYTQVLEKLAAEDYGYSLMSLLDMLEKNIRFGEYLSETMKDSAIMPVEILAEYAAGRRMEHEGDLEGALGSYGKCLGFFDTVERYARIRDKTVESTYIEALRLLEGEDLAGAYYAFDQANGYLDSEGYKASIVNMLGYTPANETDNPGAVTGLQASIPGAGQVSLTWNSAAHASKYEVAYCNSGTQKWIVSETTGKTSATVAGLAMDTVYDFRVTAVAGIVRKDTVLTGVKTAKPTPTPLVLQKPSGLKAQKTEPTSITLTWNSVPNAQIYRVMVKERSSSNWREAKNTTGTTAQITQLRAGTEYQFKVIAENGSVRAESGVITVRSATPTPTPAPTKEPIRVGGYVTFGHYEQDNYTGNGKELIEWLVLDVQGDKALLISRYALDSKPYHTKNESVTWETCSLRSWLNGEFLNSAFSAKEQQAIQLTTVDNSAGQGYSGWGTSGGKDTKDRIFLLSNAEAWRYLSDSARKCEPTKYATAQGAHKARNGNCWWWLRSPGNHLIFAAYVYGGGSLNNHLVDSYGGCVRPALWVDLGSGIF